MTDQVWIEESAPEAETRRPDVVTAWFEVVLSDIPQAIGFLPPKAKVLRTLDATDGKGRIEIDVTETGLSGGHWIVEWYRAPDSDWGDRRKPAVVIGPAR